MRKISQHLIHRSFLLASATLLVTASALPASSQARIEQSPRPILAAAQCQPLTELNYEICCIALNRNAILTDDQLDQCPPLTTSLIQQALNDSDDNDPDNPGETPDPDPDPEPEPDSGNQNNGGGNGIDNAPGGSGDTKGDEADDSDTPGSGGPGD